MVDIREVFHYVSLKRKIYFDKFMEETELNLMEIEIIIFLYENPRNNTFTEIMKSKGYAKSYVSKAISNLVEKQYITKQGIEQNKKIYKLFLLDKSKKIVDEYMKCVDAFRKDAFVDISDEELEIFEKVMKKISDNLK